MCTANNNFKNSDNEARFLCNVLQVFSLQWSRYGSHSCHRWRHFNAHSRRIRVWLPGNSFWLIACMVKKNRVSILLRNCGAASWESVLSCVILSSECENARTLERSAFQSFYGRNFSFYLPTCSTKLYLCDCLVSLLIEDNTRWRPWTQTKRSLHVIRLAIF